MTRFSFAALALCLWQSAAVSQELARRSGAPLEQYAQADVELGAVRDTRGERLRTLVTIPKAPGKHAAILLVGWLSCDSVELRPGAKDGISMLMRRLITETGAVVMRMDKPGIGDSEGDCRATDFDTELSGYRSAFAALQAHPRVDAARISLLGISNGGGFAPLVAGNAPVAAYVTIGGWSKTWFEHMIELERRRLALEGTPAGSINGAMRGLAAFHAHYLFEGLTPEQVSAKYPALRNVWYDEPRHQYGRPAAFYQQLQALDLAGAWSAVAVPTLVVWGEYDWIMSQSDQENIVALVNARRPSQARLLTVPAMDHSFTTHPNAKAAFDRMGGGAFPEAAASEIVRFLSR